MTETDLAAAVKAAVDQWMQVTPAAQRQLELSTPAHLSTVLGLLVESCLTGQGFGPGAGRAYVFGRSHCHLEGVFDSASLANTPQGFFPVPDTDGTVLGRAAALAVHGMLRLETISYGSENAGNLFVNLVSMPGAGVFAEKSKKSMRGHTDAVSFPLRGEDDPNYPRIAPSPDVVTLIGLRNPNGVPTRLMPLRDVLARLSPADVEELKKPQFSILAQKTFREDTKRILGREHVVHDTPVLKDSNDEMFVRYSHSTVLAMTTGGAAEKALENFEVACNLSTKLVVVKPSDVLIVSNRSALHGRGEVGEGVGGQTRWLLRTYGLDTSDLHQDKRYSAGNNSHTLFP